jgi:3-hydroxybutyryl-CoA dehydrogenase
MAEPLARESIVGVIGAGTMGAGIAEVAAAAGHPVRLHDSRPGAAAEACDALAARLDKRVARGKLVQAERDALVARGAHHPGRRAGGPRPGGAGGRGDRRGSRYQA